MPGVLDELEKGGGKSILDTLGGMEAPVTAAKPAVGSVLGILEKPDKGALEMAGDIYGKVEQWASKSNPLTQASLIRYTENLAKGTVKYGMGLAELAKLEVGGLWQWVAHPVRSAKSLAQGPQLLKETVVVSFLEDLKELFTHPIRYAYERPVSLILNIATVVGIGTGIKGMQTSSKIAKAGAYLDKADDLARAGHLTEAKVALEAGLGTMNKLPKSGLRLLNPQVDSVVEQLRYQDWLATYSPMSSRGARLVEAAREFKPLSKSQQFGKFAKEVGGDIATGPKPQVPKIKTGLASVSGEEAAEISDRIVEAGLATNPTVVKRLEPYIANKINEFKLTKQKPKVMNPADKIAWDIAETSFDQPMAGGLPTRRFSKLPEVKTGKELIDLGNGYKVPLVKLQGYRRLMKEIEKPHPSDIDSPAWGKWQDHIEKLELARQNLHDELTEIAYFHKTGKKLNWNEANMSPKRGWHDQIRDIKEKIEDTAYPEGASAGGLVHEFPEKLSNKGVQVTGRGDMFRLPQDMKVTDIYGTKVTLNKGHEFTEYTLSNNQVWIHDGKNVVLNKNQLQNLKNQSIKLGEKQIFTPEEAKIITIIKTPSKQKPFSMDEPYNPAKFEEYIVPGGKNYREILFQKAGSPRDVKDLPFLKDLSPEGREVVSQNIIIKEPDTGRLLIDDLSDYSAKDISKEFKIPFREAVKVKRIASDPNLEDLIEQYQAAHYTFSHWDEPNIISHARVTDRVTPDGKKIMFVEEIQSDWAKELRTQADNVAKGRILAGERIPENPLLKNWQEFTMKKLIKQAIDEGYDGISWAKGSQIAGHYDLRSKLTAIIYKKDNQGLYRLTGRTSEGNVHTFPLEIPAAELDKHVGKEIASKILEGKGKPVSIGVRSLEGVDLEVGGKWATNLYDKQIPNIVKDLTKGEIKKVSFKGGREVETNYLQFTNEVKARVIGEAPAAGGKGVIPPKPPTAVGGIPELPSFGEEKTVFERIRDHAIQQAQDVIPEGKLDAQNYERWLFENANKKITKGEVKLEYLGDYYSLKPAVSGLKKATAETPSTSPIIFNHWMDDIKGMKHPEHGQSFIAQKYKGEGEFPLIPERIYPWIRIKEKASSPQDDISKLAAAIKSPGQTMRDAWGLHNPLVDSFEAQQAAGLNAENSFRWFNKLTKGVKPEVETVKKSMAPYLNRHIILQNKKALITDSALQESLGKEIAANYKAAYDMQMKLAQTMPDVRIQLYASDQLPAALVRGMSTKEIKIGEMIKTYYAKTGMDMQRVGLPTINGKAYVRHLVAEELRNANGIYDKIPEFVKKHIPRDMAFAHRTGEFDWYPSSIGAMNNYIPIVEKKLAMQPYLIHWKDTIDAAAKSGSRAGIEAQKMITNNMYKSMDVTGKIANGITSTNYFLQLFGNARVAVKHIIGGWPAAVSEIGVFTTPGVLYTMMRHPFKSGELIKTFARLKDIIKTLDVTSGMDVYGSRFLKALAGQPTVAVEFLETGINVLGNMMKGARKDVSPELLRTYLWNKVTSVNFRGGWDIPKAFANPIGRVAWQYSLEPHKVWEYRVELVKRAMAGERDIFGTPYGAKLVQYIAIVGAMETMARGHGKTIMDTIAGVPYVDLVSPKKEAPYFQLQSPKMKLGPGVKMVADVADAAKKGEYLSILDYFIDYGLESGVGILGQLMKVSKEKLPRNYEDSISYLLGLPEVDELERWNSKSSKYIRFRTEKEELLRERNLIRKNPMLKYLINYKRSFRKKLREFMVDPQGQIDSMYNNQPQGSVLDELEQ